MQAIIMAAGKGSRLGTLTDEYPKAFLEIQGIKLLEYNIALLHNNGIRDIVLVTGYKNEQMEHLVKNIDGVICAYNPFYEMMNVLGSFYMAQHMLKIDDTVYMHADTLCSPDIFNDMMQVDADMVLPVDYKQCDEEAMKVYTSNGRIVEISKQIPLDKAEGEFIGIAKLKHTVIEDIKLAAKQLMHDKEFMSYFEGAIQELIKLNKYNIMPIATQGRFWGEVDFLEDYQYVKENIPKSLVEIARNDLINE